MLSMQPSTGTVSRTPYARNRPYQYHRPSGGSAHAFQLARVRGSLSKERSTGLSVGIVIGMLAALGIVTSGNGVTFPIAVLLGIAAAGMVAHTAVNVDIA